MPDEPPASSPSPSVSAPLAAPEVPSAPPNAVASVPSAPPPPWAAGAPTAPTPSTAASPPHPPATIEAAASLPSEAGPSTSSASVPSASIIAPPASAAEAATVSAPPATVTSPSASSPPAYPIAPAAAAGAVRYGTAPPVHHLTKAPRPLSTLPQNLRKLAYVVSIIVGSSAILAGVWSAFLLPLLHATYSARNAIVGAQKERWSTFLDKLTGIRALGIFPEPLSAEEAAERALIVARVEHEKLEKASAEEEAKDKQLALQRQRTPDSPRSASISISHTDDIPPAVKPPPVPMRADTADLSAALKDLAANLDATATTRTSLVSTLEGYTSGLHRELFLARSGGPSTPWGPVPGASTGGRVGLGTLSANLASAGGKVSGQTPDASPLGIPAARSEEWDNVRREVRAIKGLLLNRRNFSVPTRAQ